MFGVSIKQQVMKVLRKKIKAAQKAYESDAKTLAYTHDFQQKQLYKQQSIESSEMIARHVEGITAKFL